jgi:hypothetical protein
VSMASFNAARVSPRTSLPTLASTCFPRFMLQSSAIKTIRTLLAPSDLDPFSLKLSRGCVDQIFVLYLSIVLTFVLRRQSSTMAGSRFFELSSALFLSLLIVPAVVALPGSPQQPATQSLYGKSPSHATAVRHTDIL